jgi:DNA invertase Pin-like site-specific DNA recombinase
MILGYARVSTGGQDLTQQAEALRAAGCQKVIRETRSAGANADRPKLRQALKSLEPGDVLVVTAIDRLARDTRDLLNILHEVKLSEAAFRSIAEPLVDTSSELAEVVIAVLGIAAKWERGRIIARTTAGRVQAKAAGIKFGRKPTLTPHQIREASARVASGETQRNVARSFNVSQATISRIVTRTEEQEI